jgi:hypothetical protein
MQANDLSNASSPVVYVVWEGLIATTGDARRFGWYLRTHRPAKALAVYETHTRAVVAMWQVMRRGAFRFGVVTFLPAPVAALLGERLDQDHVPYAELIATTPEEFSRRMAFMPWLAAVIDPDASRLLLYGSYGRHVPPEHAEMIGWLQ